MPPGKDPQPALHTPRLPIPRGEVPIEVLDPPLEKLPIEAFDGVAHSSTHYHPHHPTAGEGDGSPVRSIDHHLLGKLAIVLLEGLQERIGAPTVPLPEGLQIQHLPGPRIESREDPATLAPHLDPGLIDYNLPGHLFAPQGLVAQLLQPIPYGGVGALDPVEGQVLRDPA